VLGGSQLLRKIVSVLKKKTKTDMEPERGQLEKETHLQLQTTHVFAVPCEVSGGGNTSSKGAFSS